MESGFDLTLMESVERIASASNDALDATRQTLACEQRVLECAFGLLDLYRPVLVELLGAPSGPRAPAVPGGKPPSPPREKGALGVGRAAAPLEGKLARAVRGCCQVLYHLITLVFSGNKANQLYAARWMGVMIEDIDDDIGSAVCVKGSFRTAWSFWRG